MNVPMPEVGDRRLWTLALGGALAMFLVQPPADLWWAAWLAPLPWLAIVAAASLWAHSWITPPGQVTMAQIWWLAHGWHHGLQRACRSCSSSCLSGAQ